MALPSSARSTWRGSSDSSPQAHHQGGTGAFLECHLQPMMATAHPGRSARRRCPSAATRNSKSLVQPTSQIHFCPWLVAATVRTPPHRSGLPVEERRDAVQRGCCQHGLCTLLRSVDTVLSLQRLGRSQRPMPCMQRDWACRIGMHLGDQDKDKVRALVPVSRPAVK